MIAIRGATTISKNSSEEIKNASIELFEEIIKANKLLTRDIISITFSCTNDIDADYPGKFVREHYSLKNTAIMHFNEMTVKNSLPLCIRVLIYAESKSSDAVFIYLRKAQNLRKDLLSN